MSAADHLTRSRRRVHCAGLLLGLAFSQQTALAADPPAAAPTARTPPAANAPATNTPAANAAPAGGTAAPAAETAKPDSSAAGPDREAMLTARLPELAAPGEAVTLDAAGAKFFAFYRAGERKPPAAGLLIVPAIGEFIDERALTRELRTIVPRGGFATLAIQPPLPAQNADAAAYAALAAPLCARVQAGLAYLASQGYAKAAIVAAASAADAVPGCFKDAWPPALIGFAAIGPWSGKLADLKLPVLDIVPTREAAAVTAADARRTEARTAQPARVYRRDDVDGMSRSFHGAERAVAFTVRGWLKRLSESLPPPVKSPAAGQTPAGAGPAAPKPGASPVKG